MAVAAFAAVALVVLATARLSSGDASAARPRLRLPPSSLASVSCLPSGWCAAVGEYTRFGRGEQVPLAELRNRRRWAISPSQYPKRALSSELSAVSCTSRRACVAVGDKAFGKPGCGGEAAPCTFRPITEFWNGESWKLEPAALPEATVAVNPELNAVSCSTARFCVAVGGYGLGSGCATLDEGKGPCNGEAIAERWDGKRWREMPTPGGVGALSAVSCSSSVACTAVSMGADCISSGVLCFGLGGAVAERWNGRRWSAEATPTVAGAAGFNSSPSLSGVACVSGQRCVAVGTYTQSGATVESAPLAEGWNGASWTVEPTPYDAQAGGNRLTSVSCGSPRACTAVGAFPDPGSTLILRWDGTTWNVQTLPNPDKSLVSVSCPTALKCVAVGAAPVDNGTAVADAWNGSRWRVESLR